jgi:hypothetical protein
MTVTHTDSPPERFEPAAAALAILFPGAGQMFLGEFARGLLVCAGVLGLFFGGILIGGVDVVDKEEDFVWFLGQSLVGPVAFGVDWVHQNRLKVIDERLAPNPANPRERVRQEYRRSALPGEGRDPETGRAVPGGTPPNTKSLGRMNELGTLFGAIAGMLNLIAILDALFHSRRPGVGAAVAATPPKPSLAASAQAGGA